MADEGSGVLVGPPRKPIAKDRAEYVDEEADPGPLVFPSSKPKLSALERLLASPDMVIADIFNGCTCGRRLELDSCGAP